MNKEEQYIIECEIAQLLARIFNGQADNGTKAIFLNELFCYIWELVDKEKQKVIQETPKHPGKNEVYLAKMKKPRIV
jgi:hypothetical protein